MKRELLFSCRHFGLCALLLILTLIVAPVQADTEAPAFDIQTSLVTPAHISLGEPVVVRCQVTNVSGRTAVVHMRNCATDWYTVVLRSANGIDVSASPNAPAIHSEDLPWVGDKTLLNNDTAIEYIPVSKIKPLKESGKYTLIVRISLQYAITSDPSSHTLVPHTVPQIQSVVLPITVTPQDTARLHAVAEQLRTAMFAGNGTAQLSMDELFCMPEADVSVVWKEAALTPNLLNDRVASQLGDLHTQAGADILLQMLNAPGLHHAVIAECINRMYNGGNSALRDHVKVLAEQRGFEMPEQAPLHSDVAPPNEALTAGTLF